jgi:signal transduction histidine kinase
MQPEKPPYEEMEKRLARAEALVEALKESEVDAILGPEDLAYVRRRREEEEARRFAAELERKVAERTQQLRALAVKLTQAEQRERQRLSELLHDHIQQLMAGAKLRVGTLADEAGMPELEESLGFVEDLLERAISASRSLSRELSPPALYSSGLKSSLEWLSENTERLHRLKVHLFCEEETEPESENLRVLLFQAVRELLFNAAKHGGADGAHVTVTRRGSGEIVIMVEDEGKGFDPELLGVAEKDQGFGLFSIRERLKAMGGEMRIDSSPGRGTRISLVSPVSLK